MGLGYKLSLLFVFLLAAVFLSGVSSSCYSASTEEKPQFVFTVRLGQIDWETRTIEAPIYIMFKNLPASFKNEKGEFNFSSISVDFEQWHNTGQVQLFPQEKDGLIIYYGERLDNRFNFRGLTELYPFDSYMLDFTFTSLSFGLINENNSMTKPENFVGGFDLREEFGVGGNPFNMTYESTEGGEEAVLNFKVYLSRSESSKNLIMQVLGICYLLVGVIPLIKPERLEHRLSICLSLFIFAVTFTFTIPIPTLNRATLAEDLIFVLLLGAGLFSVVSVVERALIEVRQRFAVAQYLIEGLVVFILVGNLQNTLSWLISPESAAEYPWASIPPELVPVLSVALLFGYVAVTLAFGINLLWKRGNIGKRLKAVRKTSQK